MASNSVATLVIFIASILIAASVAGTVTDEVGTISEAIDDRSSSVAQQIRTEVDIITSPGSEVWNRSGNQNVTVLVKNTGSTNLPADEKTIDMLVDGRYASSIEATVVDGSSWRRGNVVRLTYDYGQMNAGDHRVTVVVNGDEDVLRFNV
ncbi:MAG: flagellar protein G [Haloplanus sp.]